MGLGAKERSSSPLDVRSRLASLATFGSSERDKLSHSDENMDSVLAALAARREIQPPPPYSQAVHIPDSSGVFSMSEGDLKPRQMSPTRITNSDVALAAQRIADGLQRAELMLSPPKYASQDLKVSDLHPVPVSGDSPQQSRDAFPVARSPSQGRLDSPHRSSLRTAGTSPSRLRDASPVAARPAATRQGSSQGGPFLSHSSLPSEGLERALIRNISPNRQHYLQETLLKQGFGSLVLWKRSVTTWGIYRWRLYIEKRHESSSTKSLNREILRLNDSLKKIRDDKAESERESETMFEVMEQSYSEAVQLLAFHKLHCKYSERAAVSQLWAFGRWQEHVQLQQTCRELQKLVGIVKAKQDAHETQVAKANNFRGLVKEKNSKAAASRILAFAVGGVNHVVGLCLERWHYRTTHTGKHRLCSMVVKLKNKLNREFAHAQQAEAGKEKALQLANSLGAAAHLKLCKLRELQLEEKQGQNERHTAAIQLAVGSTKKKTSANLVVRLILRLAKDSSRAWLYAVKIQARQSSVESSFMSKLQERNRSHQQQMTALQETNQSELAGLRLQSLQNEQGLAKELALRVLRILMNRTADVGRRALSTLQVQAQQNRESELQQLMHAQNLAAEQSEMLAAANSRSIKQNWAFSRLEKAFGSLCAEGLRASLSSWRKGAFDERVSGKVQEMQTLSDQHATAKAEWELQNADQQHMWDTEKAEMEAQRAEMEEQWTSEKQALLSEMDERLRQANENAEGERRRLEDEHVEKQRQWLTDVQTLQEKFQEEKAAWFTEREGAAATHAEQLQHLVEEKDKLVAEHAATRSNWAIEKDSLLENARATREQLHAEAEDLRLKLASQLQRFEQQLEQKDAECKTLVDNAAQKVLAVEESAAREVHNAEQNMKNEQLRARDQFAASHRKIGLEGAARAMRHLQSAGQSSAVLQWFRHMREGAVETAHAESEAEIARLEEKNAHEQQVQQSNAAEQSRIQEQQFSMEAGRLKKALVDKNIELQQAIQRHEDDLKHHGTAMHAAQQQNVDVLTERMAERDHETAQMKEQHENVLQVANAALAHASEEVAKLVHTCRQTWLHNFCRAVCHIAFTMRLGTFAHWHTETVRVRRVREHDELLRSCQNSIAMIEEDCRTHASDLSTKLQQERQVYMEEKKREIDQLQLQSRTELENLVAHHQQSLLDLERTSREETQRHSAEMEQLDALSRSQLEDAQGSHDSLLQLKEEELRSTIDEKNHVVQTLEQTVRDFQHQQELQNLSHSHTVAELRRSTEHQIEALSAEKNNALEQVERCSTEVKVLKQTNEEAKETSRHHESTIEQLELSLRNAQQDLENAKEEHENVTRQNTVFTQQAIETHLQEKMMVMHGKEKEKEELQQAFQLEKSELVTMNEALKIENQHKLEVMNAKHDAVIQAHSNEIETVRAEADVHLQLELERLRSQMEVQTTAKEEVHQAHLKEMEARYTKDADATTANVMREYEEKISKLSEEMLRVSTEHAQCVTALDSKVRECEVLQASLGALQGELKTAQHHLESSKAEAVQNAQHHRNNEATLTQRFASEKEELVSSIKNEHLQQVKMLQSQLDQAVAHKDALIADKNAQLELARAAAASDLQQLREDHKSAHQQTQEQASWQLQQLDLERNRQISQLEQSLREQSTLSDSLLAQTKAELGSRIQALESGNNSLTMEISELRTDLRTKSDEVHRVNAALSNAQNEHTNTMGQYQQQTQNDTATKLEELARQHRSECDRLVAASDGEKLRLTEAHGSQLALLTTQFETTLQEQGQIIKDRDAAIKGCEVDLHLTQDQLQKMHSAQQTAQIEYTSMLQDRERKISEQKEAFQTLCRLLQGHMQTNVVRGLTSKHDAALLDEATKAVGLGAAKSLDLTGLKDMKLLKDAAKFSEDYPFLACARAACIRLLVSMLRHRYYGKVGCAFHALLARFHKDNGVSALQAAKRKDGIWWWRNLHRQFDRDARWRAFSKWSHVTHHDVASAKQRRAEGEKADLRTQREVAEKKLQDTLYKCEQYRIEAVAARAEKAMKQLSLCLKQKMRSQSSAQSDRIRRLLSQWSAAKHADAYAYNERLKKDIQQMEVDRKCLVYCFEMHSNALHKRLIRAASRALQQISYLKTRFAQQFVMTQWREVTFWGFVNEEVEDTRTEYNDRVARLTSALQKSEMSNISLNEDVRDSHHTISDLQSQLKSAQQRHIELEASVKETDETWKNIMKDSEHATNATIARLQGDLQVAGHEIQEATSQSTSLRNTVRRTEQGFAFEKLRKALVAPPLRQCMSALLQLKLKWERTARVTAATNSTTMAQLQSEVASLEAQKVELEKMLSTVVENAKQEIISATEDLETAVVEKDKSIASLQITLMEREERWLTEKLTMQSTHKERLQDIETLEGDRDVLQSVIEGMEVSAGIMQSEFDRTISKCAVKTMAVLIRRFYTRIVRNAWLSMSDEFKRQNFDVTEAKSLDKVKSAEAAMRTALETQASHYKEEIAQMERKANAELQKAQQALEEKDKQLSNLIATHSMPASTKKPANDDTSETLSDVDFDQLPGVPSVSPSQGTIDETTETASPDVTIGSPTSELGQLNNLVDKLGISDLDDDDD